MYSSNIHLRLLCGRLLELLLVLLLWRRWLLSIRYWLGAFVGVMPCVCGIWFGTRGGDDGCPGTEAERCRWKTGALTRAIISCFPSCQCVSSSLCL
jgi:hypothetical protein